MLSLLLSWFCIAVSQHKDTCHTRLLKELRLWVILLNGTLFALTGSGPRSPGSRDAFVLMWTGYFKRGSSWKEKKREVDTCSEPLKRMQCIWHKRTKASLCWGKLGHWREAAVPLSDTRWHTDSERITFASPGASLQLWGTEVCNCEQRLCVFVCAYLWKYFPQIPFTHLNVGKREPFKHLRKKQPLNLLLLLFFIIII